MITPETGASTLTLEDPGQKTSNVQALNETLLQTQAALADSELKLNVILKGALDGIIIADVNTKRIISGNPAICRMLEYSEVELCQLGVTDLHHPHDLPDVLSEFDLCRRGDSNCAKDIPFKRRDGSVFYANIVSSPVQIGSKDYLLGIVRDITEQKRTEEQQRIHEKKYEMLFESSRDALMTLSPPLWTFTGANKATLRMFGASSVREFTALGPWSLSPAKQPDGRASDEKAQEMIEIALREGSNFFEWEHQQIDGKTFPADVLLTKMEFGNELFLQATVRDITDRKRIEQTLRDANNALLQKEYLKAIFDTEPECVKVVSPDGRLLDMNLAGLRILEVDGIEEAKQLGLIHFVDECHRAAFMDLHKRVMEGNTGILKFLIKGAKGTVRWLETHATPLKDVHGRVISLLGITRDITEQMVHENELVHIAQHDNLTGLPNRTLLTDRLLQAIAQARRDKGKMAIIFLDLDKFKPVNDTFGHEVGDLLLQQVAKRLQNCLRRESDTVSRLGGDEFVILLPQLESEQDAATVAKTVVKALNMPFDVEQHPLNISTSVGIALYPSHATDAHTLLKNADSAMYDAKDAGKGCFRFYTEHAERHTSERSLRSRADEVLRQTSSKKTAAHPTDAVQHELAVSKIELEIQNEALRQANQELMKARDRYLELFDFAPVGYLSLSEKGKIDEVNLAAISLLGTTRENLINSPFTRFVALEDGDRWYLHCRNPLKTGGHQTIQLRLVSYIGDSFKANIQCLFINAECKSPVIRIMISKMPDD